MQNLQEWFETPLGNYLLQREHAYFDHAVADVFGFNAMQLGLEQSDFLRMSRIPLRFAAGLDPRAKLRLDYDFLPLAGNSIDLVVLPHLLEFSSHPHQILREVERVLMPEGQVIICGFNPRSLWGFRRMMNSARGEYPWCGNFISLPRVKDWLALLGFEVTAGEFGCYVPPFKQEKWLRRFHFMEAAGNRWWPISAGVYFLQALKRVAGMRVIKPNWNAARAAKENLAPIARKLNGQDSRWAAKVQVKSEESRNY